MWSLNCQQQFKQLHLFSPQVPFPTSSSFTQEVETALESFDFLNCSDLDEDDEEYEDKQQQEDEGKKEENDDDEQQKENQNKMEEEEAEGKEKDEENFYSEGRWVL